MLHNPSAIARMARIACGAPVPHRHPRVADILLEANRRADWSKTRALYKQSLRILDVDSAVQLPRELPDALATSIHTLSSVYFMAEFEMVRHGLAVFADERGSEMLTPDVIQDLCHDDALAGPRGWLAGRKRQPAVAEALVETCRRRRDAYQLREALKTTSTSGLLCGSTNYGAFFNVRGHRDDTTGSDLDCVIVLRDATVLDEIVEALARVSGVSAPDLNQLAERAWVFVNHPYDDGQTTLSHKLPLWADPSRDTIVGMIGGRQDYLLSLHFVTDKVLNFLLVDSVPRIEREAAGGCRTVRDYRERPPLRDEVQRSFAGRAHRMDLRCDRADLGYLRSSRAYHIDPHDEYFPGFYQSTLMPFPELLWDGLDIRPRLEQFGRKIGERIRWESKHGDHHTIRRPSFAHPRREVFAPAVIQRLDAPYVPGA